MRSPARRISIINVAPAIVPALFFAAILPASAAQKAPGPTRTPAAEPIYDTLTPGDMAIEATAKTAAESHRRLLINFGTNDCAACRVVNDAIYDDKFLPFFFEQFVPVFVDVTPGTRNAELLKRYGIDPSKGLPAIVFSGKDLKVAEVTRSGEMAETSKKGVEAVQIWITKRFLSAEENKN